MKEDQEQMLTFDQMEDRALEVGGKLEQWLMEKCLAEAARRKAAAVPCACPRCHKALPFAAAQKACVCDGQASNWTVWKTHLQESGFIPILDFLHLLTYLYAAAQAAGGTNPERWNRYAQWLTWAWQGQREKILVALNAACARAGEPPQGAPESDPRSVLNKARTYSTNNCDKMDYPRYRKLGLPISSAPIESTIKQFNKRVKGTEKCWRPSAVEAVLQVRAVQLSQDGREDRLWATPRRSRAARHKSLRQAA